ncbi:MAG: transporter substrate-binding domain-containing protein [Chitinispirillaceae bacterium]
MHVVLPILLCLSGVLGEIHGQDTLRVAVKPAPPFVITGDSAQDFSGFSIDLIQAIAQNMEPSPQVAFVYDSTLVEHLQKIENGDADLGIAATTITAEREQKIDFSQPFFEDNLALLVPRGGRGILGFLAIDLFRFNIDFYELTRLIASIGLYVFFCAMLIWLVERGRSLSGSWKGIAQGIWWTIVTMSTVGYGDVVPKRSIGKVIGVVVVFSGIVIFGVAIATLSSMLTLNRLTSRVENLNDLGGKSVAVVEGSIAEEITRGQNIWVHAVPAIDSAITLLQNRKVAAVSHDASLLQYYLAQGLIDSDQFNVVDQEQHRFFYGITFPPDSPLREPITVSLLRIQEVPGGTLNRIKGKWFGNL